MPDSQESEQRERAGTGAVVYGEPIPESSTRSERHDSAQQRMPRIDRQELAAIFVGGAIGAVLRVWLGNHFTAAAPNWPWVTFTINVTGSFALAYFATRLQERLPQSTYRRPLLGTGFCGAYTTFSTMQIELVKMVEVHRYGLAVGYAAASITAGFLAIWLATNMVRRARVFA